MTDPATQVPNPVAVAFRRRRRVHLSLIGASLVDAIGYGLLSRITPHAAIFDVAFAVMLIIFFVADIFVWRCPRCGH